LFKEEFCGLQAEEMGFKDRNFSNIKSQVKRTGRNILIVGNVNRHEVLVTLSLYLTHFEVIKDQNLNIEISV
jgi:hypothetical protein